MSTRKFLLAGMIVFAAGVIFVFVFRQQYAVSIPRPVEARRAPDIILKNYEDNDVAFSDFQGKVLLVNAWASWCPFCVKELSDFVKIQREFSDTIVVIAVNRAETQETARQFSDRVNVTGKLIMLFDPGDSFYQSIGGFSMPETIFVDKKGFIRGHKRGPMKFEEIKRKVEDTLAF